MENTGQNNTKTETTGADPHCLPAPYKTKITDKILHERFKEYGKNAKKWTQKCKLLLPKIAKYRIWEKKGFENIYEYARILAGMSRASVDDALWIGRKIEDKPALQRVAEEKGINIIKPIAAIVTAETANFWAEKAREMSKSALETYVREFKKLLRQQQTCLLPGEQNYYKNQNLFSDIKTETIQMEINPKTADELRKLKGSGDWDELMQKFIALYKEKLEAEKPAAVQTDSRYVPAAIERYVLAKTNNTCAFPGCTKPYEILHHTDRYALTHAHDPNTLVPLCKAHERLAHLGLIENENAAPERWCVRMRPNANEAKYKIDKLVARHRAAAG
ncbi:HNH endonuclease [Candidatus Peregrinibacteria bacterium]|nr:HNH endonuclease [Candidatus Peregrinibacteria bacterium]